MNEEEEERRRLGCDGMGRVEKAREKGAGQP
jgi:hypothetical protein